MKRRGKAGRPPIPEHKKKSYQRIAVYSHTHRRIVKNARKKGVTMVDYVDDIVPQEGKKDA